MDVDKKCTVCNKKLDVGNYLKYRTLCKTCYNNNGRKNNKNNPHHNQKSKMLITKKIQPQS